MKFKKTAVILKISNENFEEIVKKAVKSIKEGKVLVCPTDTVYGLLADATNKEAVSKLFKVKKRQIKKPIPIFIRNIKMAEKLAVINQEQEIFLKKVWPGKTTAVLKRRQGIKIFGMGKKTIALRIPNYKFLNALIEKINRPLTGTSANISRKPASTNIKGVIRQFAEAVASSHTEPSDSWVRREKKTKFSATASAKASAFENQEYQPDLIIDDGNLKKAKPSKVIDLTGKKPKILRK